MTIARGIEIGGHVIPGTDFVLRDTESMWKRGDRGTSKRVEACTILGGHWTGGADHDGPSAVTKVVRNMKARRYPRTHPKKPGELCNVSVHFVIAGGHLEPGRRALIWQTADLELVTSHGAVSGRAVGVEVISPGLMSAATAFGGTSRAMRLRIVDGKVIRCAAFWPSQIDAWIALAETLAALDPATGITIPRCVPVDLDRSPLLDRMTAKQIRSYRGALEHFHEDESKQDAAGMLIEPLAAAGWQGVIVARAPSDHSGTQ